MILLDECVDWRLSRDILDHEVKTARQMGWSSIVNGDLPTLAAAEFDVFVTVDRKLAFQQHVPSFTIAVIVLRARSNPLKTLQSLVRDLLALIPDVKNGAVTYVGA